MSSIPSRLDTPESTLTDNESNSSYCLLSNGDLHFLPYSNTSLANGDNPDNESYSIYTSFLNSKTVSSFDSFGSNHHPAAVPIHTTTTATTNSTLNRTNNPTDDSKPIFKLLENYKSHAIYLPDHFIPLAEDDNQVYKIKFLLLKIFPHWSLFENISIKKLTGGITNMLLECIYENPACNDIEIVLVRTYGNGTDLIIDRDREFVSHLVLNSLELAPPIHARFGNGLVYGYIEGRSLNFNELSNDILYPLIAAKLACLHKLGDINTIEDSLSKLKHRFNSHPTSEHDIWSTLLDWTEKLPLIPSMLDLCLENRDILADTTNSSELSLKSILTKEILWLKNEIGANSLPVVSHNDLLSGNIIIPSSIDNINSKSSFAQFSLNPLSFIDYEYMMPAPRAFDIANHFMEWQGFDCNKSKIPQFNFNKEAQNYENSTVFNWCYYYLNSLHSKNPNLNPYSLTAEISSKVSSKMVQDLVNEIALHYGMPGLYWGIWSCIQNDISLIDFDYATYSCERLVEYWSWKRGFLKNQN